MKSASTGFYSDEKPADEQELLYVYAALLGPAMDLTAQRLSLMTPGLSVEGLTSALQLLEDGQTDAQAELNPHANGGIELPFR